MSTDQRDNFDALYRVTQTVSSILEPRALLDTVLEIAMTHLEAERGFLLLVDRAAEKGFSVAASRNFGDERSQRAYAASSSVVQKVLKDGDPILTFDALSDERFEASKSIMAQRILSIICVPLRVDRAVSGAVYLDTIHSRGKFNEETLRFLTVFGNLSAIAIDNARRYESLKAENERLRTQVGRTQLFEGIVGKSKDGRPYWM